MFRPWELLPNPRNWRRHPREQAVALHGILAEIGFADALLARQTPDGLMLIDGHLRAEMMQGQDLPVLILDVTEEEADKILLTLDPLAGLATVDEGSLWSLMDSVKFSSDELAASLRPLWPGRPELPDLKDPLAEIDRAGELKAKWRTTAGQLWQIGDHRLLCGDCRSAPDVRRLWVDGGPKLRMVWTDPPYGVDYAAKTAWMEAHGNQRKWAPIENDNLTAGETGIMFKQALEVARQFAEPGAACYATVPSLYLVYFIQALVAGGFQYRHCLVWVKQQFVMGRSDYHYRHEPILYGWLEGAHYFAEDRTQDSVFEVDRPRASEFHPTTKPVELIARMVANSSRPGELVYDPFCGSGSTLLAAHQLGRVGYGVEIDPGYVAVTLERMLALGLKPEVAKN